LNPFVHFAIDFHCRYLIYPILPIANRISTWKFEQKMLLILLWLLWCLSFLSRHS